jgi:hypothetical protein
VPALHVPEPLQTRTLVSVLELGPSRQDAGAQVVPAAYSVQAVPAALHAPLVPQEVAP